MKPPGRSLDQLQRWMQAVVTHPGGVVAGADSDTARSAVDTPSDDIERVISRSRALTSVERLEIYNRAYFARLLECLRETYSVLAAALGEELFDTFALSYLECYPPTSYTLNDLGNRFPEYLEETRPAGQKSKDRGSRIGDRESATVAREGDWPEFLIDLARLERMVNDVFDGPGAEGRALLDADRLRAIPPELWTGARLECVPCLKLLELSYPVNDYFTAIRRGEEPELPEPGPAYVAVTRRDYRVFRYSLARPQYELLKSLLAGESIGAAIERAARYVSDADDELALRLQQWFFTWTADGFFEGIIPAPLPGEVRGPGGTSPGV